MGITIHWIDLDWNLKSDLLAFKSVIGDHTGAHLGEVVNSILLDHEIRDSLLAITTDNASNNDTMIANFSLRTSERYWY